MDDTRTVAEKTDRELIEEIRASQFRTEELVRGFVEQMAKNPMLKAMAGRFGA